MFKCHETGKVWRVNRVDHNPVIVCTFACLCKRSKVTGMLNILQRRKLFFSKAKDFMHCFVKEKGKVCVCVCLWECVCVCVGA